MTNSQPAYKPIKFNLEGWLMVKELRDILAIERHSASLSMPDAALEAVGRYLQELKSRAKVNEK